MGVSGRFWTYLAAAGMLWGGVALGAESQLEEFLEPSLAAQDKDSERAGSGNLVILTALLVAVGAMVARALLSRESLRGRAKGVLMVGLGTYALTVLVQTSWPNVDTCTSEDGICDSLTFSISALA